MLKFFNLSDYKAPDPDEGIKSLYFAALIISLLMLLIVS